MTDNDAKNNPVLDDIKTTNEDLSSRSGLAFFPPYLKEIGIFERLDQTFGSIRKIDRGLKVREAFKQLICFFVDGTDLSLSRFDELAEDKGYRKTIQTHTDQMASSDQIRRFLDGFSFVRNFHFRTVFQELFMWRIKHEQPDLITLDIDTMSDDVTLSHVLQTSDFVRFWTTTRPTSEKESIQRTKGCVDFSR